MALIILIITRKKQHDFISFLKRKGRKGGEKVVENLFYFFIPVSTYPNKLMNNKNDITLQFATMFFLILLMFLCFYQKHPHIKQITPKN